ncbi:MAG: amino acid adenylation domain-containing protein, partial [Candidatus Omnitrophica bacterium]|nr:amino acid adenylation domain-containing protein [Candidatus Omnitrophota bacterium]
SDLEVQTGTAKTDLVVMVEEGGRGLLAKVEYNTDLFDDQTVEDIIGGYIRLLERVAADPDQDLSTLLTRSALRDLKGPAAAPPEDITANYLRKTNLTENQLHLWLGQKLLGQNPLYNLKTVYTLHEPIDRAHFQAAFQRIVDNNENFRTVFYETEGIPFQRVLDQVIYEVPFLDFAATEDPQTAARQWIDSQSGNVFDLTKISFQSVLIKLADDKYQWYMSQHHILTDGWSLHLTYNRLTEYYRASVERQLDGICPLGQYSTYVKDENNFRQSSRYQKSQMFWENLLADRPEAPSFYGVTPKRKSTAIERISCPREGDLIEKINALTENPELAGIAEQTLKYHYFLSLYALFISRISGKNRIAIGVPIHNRRTKDHVDIQGLFMHIVPLVIEIDESQSMVSLMRQIKRKSFNAMKYGQFVVRNSPREPAYDVLFNYQIWRLPHFYQKAFELEWLHSGHTFESCGLQVHDFEKEVRGNEKLTFEFEFKREVFEESVRGQAMGHFFNLMSATLTHIDQPMSQLDMLSPAQRQRQIGGCNDTVRPYPVDRCVHQLFEDQALRTPDQIAVACGDSRLTYAELNARANQLAHRLIREGVASNQLVAICCRPDIDMLVGILGILKSGAAYVPLDPAYPEDRLRKMLESAGPTALVLHGRTGEMHDFTSLCASARCRIVNLDTDRDDILDSNENPIGTVTSHNLAYMIFTSGSTGIPKGAGVYHRGLTNLLTWFTQTFDFTAKDSVLLISSLSFDLTQKNLYAPLLVGGTLHLYDECYFDPNQITDRVAAEKITWLNCTPSAFYPLLDHCQSSRFAALTSLRFVFLGGEPIAMARLMPWIDTDGIATRVVNTYGPTECTDVTTYHVITDPAKVACHSVPIGQPVANVQHYILDETLRIVPWGVPGELCIAGDCVGAGYIHDAALSAKKFVPNPFGEGKLYRTGDIVRRQPDGDIVFIGRRDEQVKVRGFRIELGEIAAALNSHPDVKDAVVITRDDGHGQKNLAAYVVAQRADVSAAAIQNDLKDELPDYMVPGSVT